ncbi:pilus assembly protein [Candidatus Venteria ishoeyi]|uniref:PilC beta-propeller domain-containing protein n=1 Tax=Candidatus Venteria ishoeyi TaxID=1899563 RepID=A0A1H6F4A4_9GAMM|nr:hypothetical protein [Candidatus Venteria ishoeyi]SEH04922.1 Uncharacterised protein [Candidatus Venteria ishoeyi]
MDYSIPSDLALIDRTGDGVINRIYVGDMGGQVWRIDVKPLTSSGGRNNSLGARLAILANPDKTAHQRRFFYPPDVVHLKDQVYAADNNFDMVLISSGYRAAPLSTQVQNRFYVLRDRAMQGLEEPKTGNNNKVGNARMDETGYVFDSLPPNDQVSTAELTKSSETGRPPARIFTYTHGRDNGGADDAFDALYDATDNVLQQGDEATVELDVEQADLRHKHGWFIDLKEAGEKGLSQPFTVSGIVFFSTFVPPGVNETDTNPDVCQSAVAEGRGKIYAVDIRYGGAALNLDKDNDDPGDDENLEDTDRSEDAGSGIPPSVVRLLDKTGGLDILKSTDEGLLNIGKDGPLQFKATGTEIFWIQE